MFETLGHYKILDRIGAGGIGELFRARDTRLGRTVAIKAVGPGIAGDAARRARFVQAARAASALSHPNIATLFEIGEDRDQLFLVFEYVPGETLTNVIAGRPLNPRRAIDLGVQMADALADAHGLGLIHGDIKADNIIVTPKGNAKILDFGLAAWTSGGAERERAASGAEDPDAARRTAAYLSPEQALGERVDSRTDIFSLGTVLFEMLTGQVPFTGATSAAVALQIVQASAPAPSTVNRSLPVELDAIAGRALAKSLDQRYESAATMAAELRSVGAILDVRSDALEAAQAFVPAKPARRPIGRWLVVLLVAAAIGAAVWVEREPLDQLYRRTLAPAPAPVIVVMPLEFQGGEGSPAYLADGLADDLMARLGQTKGLKVVGRSSTRDLRGRQPRDVATELGASVILTGSVRQAGEAITLSLDLIDLSDGFTIWSGQYARDIKDIFAVQAQAAEQVATALRLTFQPTAASARVASRLVDPRAYDAYLRGRQAVAAGRLSEAQGLFEDAIRQDDGLVEAHAALAEALALAPAYGAADDPARDARLRRAADRAFELDPDAPQSNVAAALASEHLIDALGALKRAIAIDPSFAEGFYQIGRQIGDVDPPRALAFYRRALALDPLMAAAHGAVVDLQIASGRLDDAEREITTAPGSADAPWKSAARIHVLVARRQFDAALKLFDQNGRLRGQPTVQLEYADVLGMAGRLNEAYREATSLVAANPADCLANATLAALRQARGTAALARQAVGPAIAAGASDPAGPVSVRCGVLSLAAIDDAAGVGAQVRRIAASERLLRGWSIDVAGRSGGYLLKAGWFPVSRVIDQAAVVDARHALDQAYAAAAVQVASALGDVTPP
jgi:TolB-like protein